MTERAKLRPDRRHTLLAAHIRAGCVVCAMTAAMCTEISAQSLDDPAADARLHIGPLAVAPAIAITNIGRDSNVFNEARDPKSDLTATLAPAADVWLRLGRAQLSGNTRLQATFFNRYSGQGTVSTANTGRFDMVFNRFRPFVSGSFLRLNDRPSAEIDARVRRLESAATIGLAVRVAPRTSARVLIERSAVSFGGREGGIGSTLGEALDRSRQVRTAGLQYELTPLTQLLVEIQQERTRFKSAPDRDANGIRFFPGLVFKPTALVSGEVHVGFLRYTPENPRVPTFSGPVASVNVRSIIAGANELALHIDRDLFHSVEAQVYYVQTGAGAAMTRQLNARWNLSAGISRQWLTYSSRNPTGTFATATSAGDGVRAGGLIVTRPDTVSSLSFGVGYLWTRGARVGFSVEYLHRDAALESGRYNNLRTLASVTYAAR